MEMPHVAHDVLQLVFDLHHQSQEGSILVHADVAAGDEVLDELDALVDAVDHLVVRVHLLFASRESKEGRRERRENE